LVVVLVGVAVAAGFAHVAAWQIIVLELLAAGIVAATGRPPAQAGARPSYLLSYMGAVEGRARVGTPIDAVAPAGGAEPPPVTVQPDRAPEDPVLDRAAGKRPGPGTGPRPVSLRTAPVERPVAPGPRPVRNLWDLDRLAQRRAGDNEEIAFLLFYLRDFADPAGLLPTDFEPLIRETFGSLLAAAVA
jgi:hypothetical protein